MTSQGINYDLPAFFSKPAHSCMRTEVNGLQPASAAPLQPTWKLAVGLARLTGRSHQAWTEALRADLSSMKACRQGGQTGAGWACVCGGTALGLTRLTCYCTPSCMPGLLRTVAPKWDGMPLKALPAPV